ncbi:MAG: UDP-N-acetylmuramoyl-L-alanine--D-glutamate ligase [Chthonomonadales bacterium]
MAPAISEFTGKRISVVGMARTGLAAAPVLKNLGAEVTLCDSRGVSELGSALREAELMGVALKVEAAPADCLRNTDLVIPSPGISRRSPVLELAVQMGIPIMSEIEAAYRVAQAPILAVTGTNGKTTVTMLLGEIIRRAGKKTYVGGNISADDIKLPLIEAASLARESDVIVAEISSFQLEWVEKFRPKIGILTNISKDHLNRYASFDEYVEAKSAMFRAQLPTDVAVINAVNAPAHAIGLKVPGRKYWFDRGNCETCDSACVKNGIINVRWDCKDYPLGPASDLKMLGTHNLENVLAAAGAAIAFGIDPDVVQEVIFEFSGVVHRMEYVADVNGVKYYNNSMCTNVDAAVRSLEALPDDSVIIAGGVDKGSEFAPLGAMISRKCRHLVVMGKDGHLIEAAAREAGFTSISQADSMENAFELARKAAKSGDIVMLSPACASFDMYNDFEERGEHFRRIVRDMASGGAK